MDKLLFVGTVLIAICYMINQLVQTKTPPVMDNKVGLNSCLVYHISLVAIYFDNV